MTIADFLQQHWSTIQDLFIIYCVAIMVGGRR
jgi:hypothetical protein